MRRMSLVLMPNGAVYRTADVPANGIIVPEPDLPQPLEQVVIDQTAAVLGLPAPPKARALYDVEGTD